MGGHTLGTGLTQHTKSEVSFVEKFQLDRKYGRDIVASPIPFAPYQAHINFYPQKKYLEGKTYPC